MVQRTELTFALAFAQWVHRLAEDFPALRITLNGGIGCASDVRVLQDEASRLDGVMAGRWPLRDPLGLRDVRQSKPVRSVAEAISDYDAYAWRTLERKE